MIKKIYRLYNNKMSVIESCLIHIISDMGIKLLIIDHKQHYIILFS